MRSDEMSEYLEYLRREWWPEFQHHAFVVVLNKHSHEHMGTCANEGKEDRGRGLYQCRLAAPCSPSRSPVRASKLQCRAEVTPAAATAADNPSARTARPPC